MSPWRIPSRGRAGGATGPSPAGSDDPAAASLVRGLVPGHFVIDGDPVSAMLVERLEAEDIAEVERRVREQGEFVAAWEENDAPAARRWLTLSLGMHLDVPAIPAKTGLPKGLPPDNVHAMARGPWVAAGGLYEADMVLSALLSAGADPTKLRAGLDFGCSSGRVVRVLQAAYPQARWLGCDPNSGAVTWAGQNLPNVEFFVSGDEPPLPLGSGDLDLVYAISIWSHFEPELGLRWFEEMYRLLEPGGYLVFTTHGLASVERYHRDGVRDAGQSIEIRDRLYAHGVWYAAEFGKKGDWGVVNPLWGTAFLSPEWVLTKLTPRWRVLAFAPGRNDGNQDVYVLQRA